MNKKLIYLITLFASIPFMLSSCQSKNEISFNHENVNIVKANGEASIVYDAIKENSNLYEYIPINETYGFCDGLRYPVTAKITEPNGNVVETKAKHYINQRGVYQIELTSMINGVAIKANTQTNASSYSAGPAFDLLNSTFLGDKEDISRNINRYSVSKGAKFHLGASGSVISYKNIVDLKNVNGNVIEISPNPNVDAIALKRFKVTMTDAYNEANTLSIYFKINDAVDIPTAWEHGSLNTFVQVEFNGMIVANSVDFPALKNYTVLWDQGMWTTWSSDPSVVGNYVPVSFIYDYENMDIKGCSRYANWGNEAEYALIYDLNDPNDEIRDFDGFTTGEVYISIETCGFSGDLVITKIGNNLLNNPSEDLFHISTGELLTKGFDFSDMPDGAVDYYYPLPDISHSKNDVEVYLAKLDDEYVTEIEVNNPNDFYPKEAGNYLVLYSSYNSFGNMIEKGGYFKVNQEPAALEDLNNIDLNIKIFETGTIPTFNYRGGNGKLNKKIELVVGETVREVQEGNAFTITEKSDRNFFRVTVTDAIRKQRVFTYRINVDFNVVRFSLINSFDVVTVIENGEFTIPDYTAIDYSKANVNKTNIPVLIKQGKTKTYQPGDKFTVTSDANICYYYGSTLLKDITINCVPYDLDSESIVEQYGTKTGVESITASASGLNFISNGNGSMEFYQPFPLSTTNLNISFAVFPTLANYESVKFDLIGVDGNELNFEMKGVLNGKPTLYLNGAETEVSIETSREIYKENDVPSLRNKQYYSYSFIIDGGRKGLFNTSGIKNEDIKYWANGNDFERFTNGCAILRFKVDNPHAGDILSIYRISNQLLSRVGISYGDLAAPAISFEGAMYSTSFSRGEFFMIPKAFAYDVFSNVYDVKMSITDPDGESIVNNIPAIEYPLVFNKYGTYTISYSTKDERDNNLTQRFLLIVRDEEAPTITLKGNYKDSYKGAVTILDAEVKDNFDASPKLVIFIENIDNRREVVKAGDKVTLEKGEYNIIYYAFDSEGNTSRLVKHITIK